MYRRVSKNEYLQPVAVKESAGTLQVPAATKNLTDIYLAYKHAWRFDHWIEYGAHFQQHLPAASKGSRLRMLEIGVQSGGSINVWKDYYGRGLYYVGMDLNQACKKRERVEDNIHIEIGSQTDLQRLKEICAAHGPFDIVVDDGGHAIHQIKTTMGALWPEEAKCLTPTAVYAIEDLHTMAECQTGYCNTYKDYTSFFGELQWAMHRYGTTGLWCCILHHHVCVCARALLYHLCFPGFLFLFTVPQTLEARSGP